MWKKPWEKFKKEQRAAFILLKCAAPKLPKAVAAECVKFEFFFGSNDII